MRPPEYCFVCFFVYIALISGFFHDRPQLHFQPVIYVLALTALFLLLNQLQRGRMATPIAIVRDWLPIFILLVAFREMELFSPAYYNLRFENQWIKLDELVLHDWGGRAAIESAGVIFPFYLEFCYLLVYGLAAFSLSWIVWLDNRKIVDYFWTVYLTGTLTAYGLFPYFPSLPPRFAFAAVEPPHIQSWVRTLNLDILNRATIHAGVFPSAHVSSAFSATWALYFIFPKRRWLGHLMLFYALSVSIATIYGRYHYVADVLAGFGISLLGLWVAIAMKDHVQKY